MNEPLAMCFSFVPTCSDKRVGEDSVVDSDLTFHFVIRLNYSVFYVKIKYSDFIKRSGH